MNVLVTGSNGQLALTIKELFETNKDEINFIFKSKSELDITNYQEVQEFFEKNAFHYCVNCAAFTNVELAESESETAFSINAEAVKNLAIACKNQDVVLIHISTDYVFDGQANKPYKETDQTNPINVYGSSKLKGERHIEAILEHYFIIRASWLYSVYGHNFFKTVVRKIKNEEIMNVINTQIGVPTSCEDLAVFIYFLITGKNKEYGLYHFAPDGETSWFGFASFVASHYNNQKVQPVEFFKTQAQRPNYSVLDNSKVKLMGFGIRAWQSALDEIINKYNKCLS